MTPVGLPPPFLRAPLEKLCPALPDTGAPFAAGTSVVDDGTLAEASDLNGYSIVEADTLDGAKALADGRTAVCSVLT